MSTLGIKSRTVTVWELLLVFWQNWDAPASQGEKISQWIFPNVLWRESWWEQPEEEKPNPHKQLLWSCVADTFKTKLKWKYLSLYLCSRWYPKFNPIKNEWGFLLGHWFMIRAALAWGSGTELPNCHGHKPHIVIDVKIKASCDPRTHLMKDKEFGQTQWFSDGPFPPNNSFIFHQAAPSSLNS